MTYLSNIDVTRQIEAVENMASMLCEMIRVYGDADDYGVPDIIQRAQAAVGAWVAFSHREPNQDMPDTPADAADGPGSDTVCVTRWAVIDRKYRAFHTTFAHEYQAHAYGGLKLRDNYVVFPMCGSYDDATHGY